MAQSQEIKTALARINDHRDLLGNDVTQTLISALEQYQGSALPTTHRSAQRKQITVLFAGIPGLTAIADTMDAEDVVSVTNQLWRNLDDIILSHGGHIDRHIGTAVMALWGVNQTREDDAERAVRAGLAMLKATHQFSGENPHTPLQLRIGIHSGPVILGHVGTTSEYTAIGDTVNTASCLEIAAAPDDVLIGYDTYLLVRSHFVCEEKKRLSTKAGGDQIRTYKAQQEIEFTDCLPTQGIEGVHTRTIGRENLLTQALSVISQVFKNRKPGLITLTGEAGIGKSRLVSEIENWLASNKGAYLCLKSRATQELKHQPYATLRKILLDYWKISLHDLHTDVAQQEVFEIIYSSDIGLSKDQVISILQLLGLARSTDENRNPRQAEQALLQYIQHTSRHTISCCIIEDIQWLDESTLAFLASLYKIMDQHRFFILATARSEFLHQHRDWGTWASNHKHIKLELLSEESCHKLATEILKKLDEIPEELETILVQHSNGNPLYMEELIMMLITNGAIITGSNQWIINPTKLSSIRLPPTLTGILQARLESLSEPERTVLQQSAVIGTTFWPEVVEHVQQKIGEPMHDLDAIWKSLTQLELIKPAEPFLLESRCYAFTNSMLREVAHESVLLKERRAYHAHVAQWLIEHCGKRNEFYTHISEHLEQAENSSQAVIYLRQAGEQALQNYGFREAVHFFKRALALLAQTDNYEDRIQLTREIGRAMMEFGQIDNAKKWLQDGLAMARQSDKPQEIMEALKDLSQLAQNSGEYQEAMTRINEGLEVIKKYKVQIDSKSSAYFKKAKEGLPGLLSSASGKLTDMWSKYKK